MISTVFHGDTKPGKLEHAEIVVGIAKCGQPVRRKSEPFEHNGECWSFAGALVGHLDQTIQRRGDINSFDFALKPVPELLLQRLIGDGKSQAVDLAGMRAHKCRQVVNRCACAREIMKR